MYSSGSTNSRPFGSTATYTCVTGYTLNRGSTTRTCGRDGVWSGFALTCQRKQCLCLLSVSFYSYAANCYDLPPLPNGAISYNGGTTDNRLLNTIATHSCNTGYTLTGDSVRHCQNDRIWSGSTPTCQGEDINSTAILDDNMNIFVDSFLWPSSLY